MIIGFIGAGVMARALAKGIVRGNIVSDNGIICSAPNREDGQPFLDLLPSARWFQENAKIVDSSNITIIAVKPQVLAEALEPVKKLSAGKLFLSIAAGVTIEKLQGMLDPTARIIRAMPNTPMQIGAGASVYAGGSNVNEADYALAESILAAAGKAWRGDEAQIDAVTALSGSAPAYVFHFIEALIRGGVELGLSEALAKNLALQTVLGSAQLAAQSTLAPMDLAAQVKSPRGTTLAGCAILEENDALNQLVSRCMTAAKTRAEELARGEK